MALPPADYPMDLIVAAWDRAISNGGDLTIISGAIGKSSVFHAGRKHDVPKAVPDFFGSGRTLRAGPGCNGSCREPGAFVYLVPNRRVSRPVPRLYGPELARLSASIRQHLPVI